MVFNNPRLIDNYETGIQINEVIRTDGVESGITGGMIGGQSHGWSGQPEGPLFGIICPNTNNFSITGTSFRSWSHPESYALSSYVCEDYATESNAVMISTSELSFDSATNRVWFNEYDRSFWHDEDGSLTGGEGYWLVGSWMNHFNIEGCTLDETVFNAWVCDETIIIRRSDISNAYGAIVN